MYRAKVLNWSVGIAILSTSEFVNFTKQTPLGGRLEIKRSCSIRMEASRDMARCSSILRS